MHNNAIYLNVGAVPTATYLDLLRFKSLLFSRRAPTSVLVSEWKNFRDSFKQLLKTENATTDRSMLMERESFSGRAFFYTLRP